LKASEDRTSLLGSPDRRKANVDLRVGSEDRIAITYKGGNVHTILGPYRLIDPPR
jgi:hypothetical protein